MSESSPEADRVDESAFGGGGVSSADADYAASGADGPDVGPDAAASEGADEAVSDSHAADVDAGFDDSGDSPAFGGRAAEEDGTL